MGDANPIRTLEDYSRPSHEGYRNTIELPERNNVVPLRFDTIRNAKEFWALLEDLALYDNESWNDSRDFAKPNKAISLPQDVPSTSDHRLIELENQVQRLMEAHLAPKQPIQLNKITSSCEICSGPHDTQYYMKNPEQAFVEYASSRTDKAGEQNRNPSSPKCVHFVKSIIILNKEDEAKEEGSVKSSVTENKDHKMTFESEEEFEEETKEETEEEEEDNPEHFDTFLTMKELGYHEWLLLHYNWIMSNRLESRRKPSNPKKICNFMRRVRGLKVFIGNFTYECDFMVLEDTTSVIDHDLSSVVIFDEKKLGSSYEVSLDNSWRTI
ncbi:hypothetical protein Tco_0800936 [Tanacetum coccineum]|uniref:MAK10-like protein n=1 Tax=Tanacetum coccineum TaxID=301880 RepID=A0ABQ4ZYZ5_9ASTR